MDPRSFFIRLIFVMAAAVAVLKFENAPYTTSDNPDWSGDCVIALVVAEMPDTDTYLCGLKVAPLHQVIFAETRVERSFMDADADGDFNNCIHVRLKRFQQSYACHRQDRAFQQAPHCRKIFPSDDSSFMI